MKTRVDLLLVNPGNRLEQFAQLSNLATVAPPLGVAMIASFVRAAGHSVAIIDAEAESWTPEETVEEIERYDPLVVGVSAFTTKMTAAGKVLSLLKQRMPQVKTLLGGHHASAIPERTLLEEAADYVIQGEGFYPAVDLVAALKDGCTDPDIQGVWYRQGDRIVGHGRAAGVSNLDDLPYAAWDLLPMHKYRAHHWQTWDRGLDPRRFALLYTSLGCPFSCEYCSVNVVYGKHTTRFRSPERVVAEMEMLVDRYGVKHIEIIDDTFTLNPRRVEKICDQIVEAGLGEQVNMWCFARTDRVEPRLMDKMKRAGINWVFMGIESGDDDVLEDVHKKQTVDQIKIACNTVHAAGIHIGGNYVFGLPTDTPETMRRTLDLAKELNTEYANFFILMPYPGTALYEIAQQRHYPLPEKWGQYGFFAPDALPMRNEVLSPEEIITFRDAAFREYFHSDHYQQMIFEVFGPEVLEFIQTQVLSKEIVRTRVHALEANR